MGKDWNMRISAEAQGSIRQGDSVLMGVSGGADSLCLFHLLLDKWGESAKLHVCHVHHHLRQTADRDESFVRALCEERGVPYHRVDVDVKALVLEKGLSTEEAARMLRYRAFRRILQEIEPEAERRRLAVAHTLNDNAETFLHNLFRGSGLRGLGGIRMVQPMEDYTIVRPLLNCSREDVEAYLRERGQQWCSDESNETDDYARNRIRRNILPLAREQVNSRAALHVHSAAVQLAAAEDFMEEMLQRSYRECCEEDTEGGLRIARAAFMELHPYLQQRLALLCMQQVSGNAKDISAVHVRVFCELFSLPRGKMLDLPHGLHATRQREYVELLRKKGQRGC